jgi:TDG/mug DNA glycosylase family protein
LDSDIVSSSIVTNDFGLLFEAHPSIRIVCFNGAKAASAFRRHVLPRVAGSNRMAFHCLPSTSPANASISLERKRAAWSVLCETHDTPLHLPAAGLDLASRSSPAPRSRRRASRAGRARE